MSEYLKDISNYWNTRADGYSLDNQEELDGKQAEAWQKLINHYIDIKKGMRVLDLGCGPGFFSILLSRLGCFVEGIDYSEAMLLQAQSNAEKYGVSVHFTRMDAQHLDFEDACFDLVISRNVTWNLEQPKLAYQEILRVLKPNGHLLNYDGNYYYQYHNSAYQRASQSEHRHMEGIDVSIIDHIARYLPLSYQLRPFWDEKTLRSLGASSVEYDIVDQEESTNGKNIIRSFIIHAVK